MKVATYVIKGIRYVKESDYSELKQEYDEICDKFADQKERMEEMNTKLQEYEDEV